MLRNAAKIGLVLYSCYLQAQNTDYRAEPPGSAKWWAGIKSELLADTGDIEFDSKRADSPMTLKSLKGGIAGFTMQGIVVEAKPVCAPKEILVYIPTPGQQGVQPAEITLKLDTYLNVTERSTAVPSRPFLRGIDSVRILGPGRVDPGSTVTWRGLRAESLTKDPFMLTVPLRMIELQTSAKPCSVVSPAKPARNKKAAKPE